MEENEDFERLKFLQLASIDEMEQLMSGLRGTRGGFNALMLSRLGTDAMRTNLQKRIFTKPKKYTKRELQEITKALVRNNYIRRVA